MELKEIFGISRYKIAVVSKTAVGTKIICLFRVQDNCKEESGGRHNNRRKLLRNKRNVISSSAPLSSSPSFFSAFFVFLLFHILLILLTWSYLMVVLNDSGSIPHNWRHHQQLRSDFDLETAPPTPSPACCSRCQNGKPQRCSICKQLSHFQTLLLFTIATPFSPFFRPKVCSEDGSSLHLGRQLCCGT